MTEIACTNCQAACCQGGTIELTLEEAGFMLRGGNRLITIAQPVDYDREEVFCPTSTTINSETGQAESMGTLQPLAANTGRYVMMEACKFLEETDDGWQGCSVYDERPATCQRFEVGGAQCQILREVAGIDPMSASTETIINMIAQTPNP